MLVSVVIPTYNKAKYLYLTLLSLEHQFMDEPYEVIVVDDGSTDDTADMIKKKRGECSYRLIYVYQKNRGRAAARNHGVQSSHGEYIIFLDDDRVVKRDYIKNHMKAHYSSDRDCVVLGKRNSIYLSMFETNYNAVLTKYRKNSEDFFLHSKEEYYWNKVKHALYLPEISWIAFVTGNVSIKKVALLSIGLFQEVFTGWGLEDQELGYRIWENNIALIECETAVNYHLEHQRNREKQLQEMNHNLELLQILHHDKSVDLFKLFIDGTMSLGNYYESCSGQKTESGMYNIYYKKLLNK